MIARSLGWGFTALVYLFLFAPIVATVVLSFNASMFGGFPMTGLSLHWYRQLWQNEVVLAAFRTSLWIALVTAAATAVIATMAALALVRAGVRHLPALAALVLGLALPGAAAAHREGAPPPEGIAISSLTHGQMAVIARHKDKILGLTARHYPPDDTLRRLTNHAEIQSAWCLWGLVPGTVADEESPFNLCAHAYLAATRDALLRLQALRPGDAAVDRLVQRIETDMIAEGAALALCGYSDAAFSTAEVIRPDWAAVPGHWPSLTAFAALGGLAAAAGWMLRRRNPVRLAHSGPAGSRNPR